MTPGSGHLPGTRADHTEFKNWGSENSMVIYIPPTSWAQREREGTAPCPTRADFPTQDALPPSFRQEPTYSVLYLAPNKGTAGIAMSPKGARIAKGIQILVLLFLKDVFIFILQLFACMCV